MLAFVFLRGLLAVRMHSACAYAVSPLICAWCVADHQPTLAALTKLAHLYIHDCEVNAILDFIGRYDRAGVCTVFLMV